MNMKRLIRYSLYISLLAVMMVMNACTKDDPNPLADSTGDLPVSVTERLFPVEGGTSEFTVQGGTAFVRDG